MRLLVITDLFPPVAFGGYELTCATLVEGLRDRHDVVVLTSDLRRDTTPPVPWVRRELPYLGPERRAALRAPAASARAASLTRRALDAVRPDLVYVSNCLGIPQAAPWVALEAGVPTLHGLAELWFASTLYRGDRFMGHLRPGRTGLHRPYGWMVRTANLHPTLRLDPTRPVRTAVSWCSDDLRRRARLPAVLEPVVERTIHPGVGGPFASLERRPSSRPTIAYVGRVTRAKGAELAVRAAARLRAAHGIRATLVLAGPCAPEMRARLLSLAGELGIGGDVELCGPLAIDGVGALLEHAHVVVVPSCAHEAFGRTCVEAALARVPVVAAEIGGIPEALRAEEHALHFTPGDADACAAALARTLRDPEGTLARTRRAADHAKRFSVERFVSAHEALMGEAVDVLGGAPWRVCA